MATPQLIFRCPTYVVEIDDFMDCLSDYTTANEGSLSSVSLADFLEEMAIEAGCAKLRAGDQIWLFDDNINTAFTQYGISPDDFLHMDLYDAYLKLSDGGCNIGRFIYMVSPNWPRTNWWDFTRIEI